jgi:hypothetical protein
VSGSATCRIASRIAWSSEPRNDWWVGVLIPRMATKVFRFQLQSFFLRSPSLSCWERSGLRLPPVHPTVAPWSLIRSGVDRTSAAGGECRIASTPRTSSTPLHNYQWVTNGRHLESGHGGPS